MTGTLSALWYETWRLSDKKLKVNTDHQICADWLIARQADCYWLAVAKQADCYRLADSQTRRMLQTGWWPYKHTAEDFLIARKAGWCRLADCQISRLLHTGWLLDKQIAIQTSWLPDKHIATDWLLPDKQTAADWLMAIQAYCRRHPGF